MKKTDELYGLEDKVVALTGGAGVLCSSMAVGMGECGAKIAIMDIAEEAMDEVSAELEEKDIEHITVKTNVLEKDSIQEAADEIVSEFGRVDVLINGAGGNKPDATTGPDLSFFDLPQEAVDFVFDLNFIGTFLTSQVFGRLFAEQEEGIIINVSSMNALTPLTKIPAYSAAKAAVSNFTQWLAVHMSQNYSTNIRVNAIAPGFLLTEQNRFLLLDKETEELTPRGQTIIDHTPMQRFGAPEELVGAVVWLASPSASLVHGAIIPLDGGFSAFSGV